MRWFVTAALAFVLVGSLPLEALGHSGNVRRSDCTHVDRKTGNRHRHTGRPYCDQFQTVQFLTAAWMHH